MRGPGAVFSVDAWNGQAWGSCMWMNPLIFAGPCEKDAIVIPPAVGKSRHRALTVTASLLPGGQDKGVAPKPFIFLLVADPAQGPGIGGSFLLVPHHTGPSGRLTPVHRLLGPPPTQS